MTGSTGPFDIVRSRLQNVRGSRATCPNCNRRAVLSFRQTDDGTILLKCFRGCNASEITAAIGLDLRALFVARTQAERHERADSEDLEREAYRRDPGAYLRGRLRTELARVQRGRAREHGSAPPLRSVEVDRARRHIAVSLGLDLCEVPAAIGWPLWPRVLGDAQRIAPESSTTMPALWEWTPHDLDPAWPAIYMVALEVELAHLRAVDPTFAFGEIENPWAALPHTLFRAAERARSSMCDLVAVPKNESAA